MTNMIASSAEWRRLNPGIRSLIERHQALVPVDLQGLAKALGLPVKAATLPPGRSGEIRPDGNSGYIVRVNRHDNAGRQRFTVAHEIAHFLLHRDLIGAGILDDALYRSNQSDRVEAEANRLAADLVMPAALVKDAMAKAEHFGSPDVAAQLAATFLVSPLAMSIRLGMAG